MDAGTLRENIQIITPVVGRNAFGESITGWNQTIPVIVAAAVRQQSSAEQVRNGLSGTDNSYAIRIRYREDVTGAARITYRGRTLEIASIIEGGHAGREWLDIVAKEAK